MQIQPQLMLLQKTLLNVEGLGRDLYPELDVWSTATPILREWMRERTSVRTLARELRTRVPELLEAARGLPALLSALVEREYARLQPPAAAPDAASCAPRSSAPHGGAMWRSVGARTAARRLVWLAMARDPVWLGWALLAAGAAAVVHGLWRSS